MDSRSDARASQRAPATRAPASEEDRPDPLLEEQKRQEEWTMIEGRDVWRL